MANELSAEERRRRINQSTKVLPGDQQRARDEEREDFDADDSGSLGTRAAIPNQSKAAERREINQSTEVLPGDRQRARDDEAIDSGAKAKRKSARQPDHIMYRP